MAATVKESTRSSLLESLNGSRILESLKFPSTGKSTASDTPTNIDEITKIVGYVNEEVGRFIRAG
jgi:hypothetical protein